jgi:hypothetical protein
MYNLVTCNQGKRFMAVGLPQEFLQYALPVMGASSETRMVAHTHTQNVWCVARVYVQIINQIHNNVQLIYLTERRFFYPLRQGAISFCRRFFISIRTLWIHKQ